MVDIHEYPYTHTHRERKKDSYVTHKVSKFYKRTDKKSERKKRKRETRNEKEKLCAMRIRMVRDAILFCVMTIGVGVGDAVCRDVLDVPCLFPCDCVCACAWRLYSVPFRSVQSEGSRW